MQNLRISKNGIWQFRYQIPKAQRHLFGNRYEIKRSLRTGDKQIAIVKALQLELEVRVAIQQNQPLSALQIPSNSPAKPATSISKANPTSLESF
ncbi:DUF6538 domain-containing protein [Photobacterium leiognathi subsp. mandapamensis]